MLSKILKASVVCSSLVLMAACEEELPLIADNNDSQKQEAVEVLAPNATASPALNYEGIISQNIQNLLCNSVHHAEDGRLDQAAHKLDLAKNKKLVALLSKNQITQEEYISLDEWMAELTELLYADIEAYPAVEQSFPFSCAGKDEQTEAIGEVIELQEEYDNENANDFLRKVCFSMRSADKQNVIGYAQVAEYLAEASVIAGTMYYGSELDENQKDQLVGWLEDIVNLVRTDITAYGDLSDDFNCELYADETDDTLVEDVVDEVEDIIDDIGDFFGF